MATTPTRTRQRAPGAPAPAPAPAKATSKPAGKPLAGPPKPAAPGFLKALHAAASKQYGEGTMTPATAAYSYMRHIPFGHLVGDLCSLGGLREGQASMFIGREGAGKTTQAMRCVAQAQMKYPNHHALWVDTEGTFDAMWAQAHGVDLNRLHLVQTVRGEEAADLMKVAVAEAEELCFAVLDSVNQTTPMKEYEDSIGDAQVALLPRLMGRLCSHLSSAQIMRMQKKWVPVTQVFINQWRTTIGGPPRSDNRVIPGGTQLKHYCSTHIDFKAKVESEKDETDNTTPYIVEHTFNMRRVKGPSSLRVGEYAVVVGADHPLPIGSYDESGTILGQAKRIGMWEGAGANQRFTAYPDNVFRTMEAGREWLEANPAEALEIKRAIVSYHRVRVGMTPLPADGYLLRWPRRGEA